MKLTPKELERRRKWRADNPDKVKAYNDDYAERCADKKRAANKKWRAENKQYTRNWMRQYYLERRQVWTDSYQQRKPTYQRRYDRIADVNERNKVSPIVNAINGLPDPMKVIIIEALVIGAAKRRAEKRKK